MELATYVGHKEASVLKLDWFTTRLKLYKLHWPSRWKSELFECKTSFVIKYIEGKSGWKPQSKLRFPHLKTCAVLNISLCAQTFSLWCSLKITDMRKRTGWQRNHRKHPCRKHKEDHMTTWWAAGECVSDWRVQSVHCVAYLGEAQVEVSL